MWGFDTWLVLGNGMWTDKTGAISYQKLLEVLQIYISHLELLPFAIITMYCSSGGSFNLVAEVRKHMEKGLAQ